MFFKIFLLFLKIGFFVFGGGYAMIPLIQEEVIRGGLLTQDEFLSCLAIAQITPGPIAVITTAVGYKLNGISGAFSATVGTYLPSFFIMIFLSKLHHRLRENKYIKAAFKGIILAVIGMILSATIQLLIPLSYNIYSFFIVIIIFLLLFKLKLDYLYAIILSGFLGLIFLR